MRNRVSKEADTSTEDSGRRQPKRKCKPSAPSDEFEAMSTYQNVDDALDESEKVPDVEEVTKTKRQWDLDNATIFDVDGCPEASRRAAMLEVKSMETWSFHYRNAKINGGVKEYFRCNLMKRRGPQCPAALYLEYPSTNWTVRLVKTINDHDHAQSDVVLTKDVKSKIEAMVDLGATIDKMWEVLKGSLKNRRQLVNQVATMRKAKKGPSKMDGHELRKLCEELSAVPSDEDEVFVVDFAVEENAPRVLFSTPRLLRLSVNADRFHADGTYKLLWENFPVLAFGVTDRRRQFTVAGMVISPGETTADYAWAFSAFAKGWQKLNAIPSFK